MAAPKMGNTYPSAISSYPTWVAHETPYTAEWGNSVGYEFHLIEYELGSAPRGQYNSVKDRLDSFPEFSGYNYWARGYYMHNIQRTGPGSFGLYFNVAEHDKNNVFDLTGRRNVTAPVTGWYHVIWNLFIESMSGDFPCAVWFKVRRSRGGIYLNAGENYLVIERAGFYSMRVDVSVHLEKDEYINADIYIAGTTLIHTRPEYDSNVVDFRLITTDAYDRR